MAVVKKTSAKLITKKDIEDSLSVYDIDNIKVLREDLKNAFPKKEEAPKKTRTKKSDTVTEPKPKANTRKSKPKSEKTETVVKKKEEHLSGKYKIGDKVFLYFGKDRLNAKIVEILPANCYKVEWLNFKENYNHPFVIGCPFKYVHESLCHDLMEAEIKKEEE